MIVIINHGANLSMNRKGKHMAEILKKMKTSMKQILCDIIDDVDKILKERSNDTKQVLLNAVSKSIDDGLEKGKKALKNKIMMNEEEEENEQKEEK